MHIKRTVAATVVLALAAGLVSARASQDQPGPIERLKAGNARFVANPAVALPLDAERRLAQTKGQSPFAIVLSCADSRVPPELIFNAGLGELFVVRTAGQVADRAVLASIEYGAEHLHAPVLVAMGHESCGAVTAALGARPGAPSMGPNLDALVSAITPAFQRMTTPADAEHIRDAVLANVEEGINQILAGSAIVKHLVQAGKLQVVGAYYELATGRVRFSEQIKVSPEPTPHAAGAHR